MDAVEVCTNNSVFATTLFARHNLTHLSRHPLYSGAAIYCRAAQEQFLKSLFLYNLCKVLFPVKTKPCMTITMHYPGSLTMLGVHCTGSLTMLGVHCTGSLTPPRPQSYCKQHFLVFATNVSKNVLSTERETTYASHRCCE